MCFRMYFTVNVDATKKQSAEAAILVRSYFAKSTRSTIIRIRIGMHANLKSLLRFASSIFTNLHDSL